MFSRGSCKTSHTSKMELFMDIVYDFHENSSRLSGVNYFLKKIRLVCLTGFCLPLLLCWTYFYFAGIVIYLEIQNVKLKTTTVNYSINFTYYSIFIYKKLLFKQRKRKKIKLILTTTIRKYWLTSVCITKGQMLAIHI